MFRYIKPIIFLVVVLILSISGLNCAAPSAAPTSTSTSTPTKTTVSPTPATPILIKIATPLGETDLKTIEARDFASKVEQQTNGRVKFEIYASGSLFQDSQIHTGVSQGLIQMGITGIAYPAQVIPLALTVSQGLIFSSRDQFWRSVDGDLGQMISKEFETKLNIKVLSYTSNGPTGALVSNKKQIKTPADLKGLLWRSPSAAYEQYFSSLGASPVTLSASDVYTALQRGTIDGALSNNRTYLSNRFYEAANYITNFQIDCDNAVPVMINLATWNQLPADIQTIFMKVAQEEEAWSKTQVMTVDADNWTKIAQIPNLQIYTVPTSEYSNWYNLTSPDQKLLLDKALGKPLSDQVFQILAKYK